MSLPAGTSEEQERQKKQELLRAQRAYLGLDPDAAPSYGDMADVWELIKATRAGKRPDMAPPGFEPSWIFNPSLPMPQSDPSESSSSAQPESGAAGSPSPPAQPHLMGPLPGTKSIADLSLSDKDAEEEEAGGSSGNAGQGPPLPPPAPSPEALQRAGRAMSERREKEMQTKDGRARWERLEAGALGPPGAWKAWQELEARRRLGRKLDFRDAWARADELEKAAAKARKEAADAKAAAPAPSGSGKKGKKK